MYILAALFLFALSFGLTQKSIGLAVVIAAMAALGMGNGAVFQLVPQRFRKEIGIMTGLVGMAGGVGGFYLASSLGYSKQVTGDYQVGLIIFAGLAILAMIGLMGVKTRWRTTWGSVTATTAKV
jgi:NNP family nitrate/nitrite transporter-like MFS transporter